MANDGSASTGEGEELKASVGEQLREKAHLDDETERERREAEQRATRVERHKQEERAEVARHVGDPESWSDARRAARQAPVRRGPPPRSLVLLGLGIALASRLLARLRSA